MDCTARYSSGLNTLGIDFIDCQFSYHLRTDIIKQDFGKGIMIERELLVKQYQDSERTFSVNMKSYKRIMDILKHTRDEYGLNVIIILFSFHIIYFDKIQYATFLFLYII
jgi:hypothetical protein